MRGGFYNRLFCMSLYVLYELATNIISVGGKLKIIYFSYMNLIFFNIMCYKHFSTVFFGWSNISAIQAKKQVVMVIE